MESQAIPCFICSLALVKEQQNFFQCAVHSQPNDGLKLEKKIICKPCMHVLINIEKYSVQKDLIYCNHYFESNVLQALPPMEIRIIKNQHKSESLFNNGNKDANERVRSISDNIGVVKVHKFKKEEERDQGHANQNNHSYCSHIFELIQKQNMTHLKSLPKALQYLIYLSSKNKPKSPKKIINSNSLGVNFVTAEERHVKIKNLLLFFIEKISISLEELPFILIIVNCLLCHMDVKKIYPIIFELSHLIIQHSEELSWKTLAFCEKIDKPENRIEADKIWMMIEAILQIRNLPEENFSQVVNKIVEVESNTEHSTYQFKITEIIKEALKNNKETKKMMAFELEELYALKSERNNYGLMLKSLFFDEEILHKKLVLIENKYKKQKEEYITKIVKLNNHIEDLELQLQRYKDFNHLQQSGSKNTQEQMTELTNQQKDHSFLKQNLSPIHRTSPDKYDQAIQERSENSEHSDKENQTLLQSIITLTGLLDFGEKISVLQKRYSKINTQTEININKKTPVSKIIKSKPQQICHQIIEEINKFEESMEKIFARNKLIEDEKNRLLDILGRKQERFINLIHQKDIIIEKYENALWKMENGIEVVDEPLSHRIKYIIMKINTMTAQEEQNTVIQDEEVESTPHKKKKHKINSTSFIEAGSDGKNKLKNSTVKNEKQKDKDCEIY